MGPAEAPQVADLYVKPIMYEIVLAEVAATYAEGFPIPSVKGFIASRGSTHSILILNLFQF
jgi:hypothetical protein